MFTGVVVHDHEITFEDNLDQQDVGSVHRFKYALTVDDGSSTPLTSDPEIQNEREPRLGG